MRSSGVEKEREREREKQREYSSTVFSLSVWVYNARSGEALVGADEREGIKPCSAARSIQPPPPTQWPPHPRPFFRSLFTDPHPSRRRFFLVFQPSFPTLTPHPSCLPLATFLHRYHSADSLSSFFRSFSESQPPFLARRKRKRERERGGKGGEGTKVLISVSAI